MFKLEVERAKNPDIKLPTSLDHRKSKRITEKKSTSASMTMLKPLTLQNTTDWKILKEMGISDHFICLLKNMLCGSRSNN